MSSKVSEPVTETAVDLGSCCAARGVSAECADICRARQLQYSALVELPQVKIDSRFHVFVPCILSCIIRIDASKGQG